MSSLRSALDELRGDDLMDTPAEQLSEDLVELRETAEALEAEWIRRLNAFDARQGWAADGSLSLSAWLRARCRMTGAAAADRARLARALRKMPLTQRAFSDGDLTTAHVRALSAGAEAHPETFARDEEVLVTGASAVSAGDTRKLVDYWRQNLDHEEALDHSDKVHQRRRLSISRTWRGMVRIDGDLDPEAGEVVLAAIGSLVDELVKSGSADDNRTPSQRRADALTELCRQHLDSGRAAISGGERPHINVLLDLASLQGAAGEHCELASGEIIHPEAARRLACDAGINRIITNGPSQILDVGRTTRTVSGPTRRALVIRDGGCRFDGCGRPAAWCDAHHVVHWVDGGETTLDNLVLLCRSHHRMVHEGRFPSPKP
ncbi:MAG: HNH endonuclease [Acidimicrobiia bacterium]|nr:HNH endonuclease [Acidimicrobiia bacterium]